MNMKVHQTLVWLNLLSLGTKDFNRANNRYTIRALSRVGAGEDSFIKTFTNNTAPLHCHFVCITPERPSFQLYTEHSAVQYVPPPPHTDLTLSRGLLYWPALLSLSYRPGGQWTGPHVFSQTQREPAIPPHPGGAGGWRESPNSRRSTANMPHYVILLDKLM